MSNTNPKRFAILCRKLLIVSDVMAETIHEIEQHGYDESEFKTHLDAIKVKLEDILRESSNVPEVLSTNYLQQLSKQFDTLIRKNFNLQEL